MPKGERNVFMVKNYVEKSLALHLFSGRIMKEHAFFLKAGFTPANPDFAQRAEFYKTEFEKLLSNAVTLANGVLPQHVLCSGEIVTEFTAAAERKSECFTGIAINKEITARELHLRCGSRSSFGEEMRGRVCGLNKIALCLLDGLIAFKEEVLKRVLCCEMFTVNYPSLIEHIIREAKLYRESVEELENDCRNKDGTGTDRPFWNRIMMEHALFIRGSLDPCEAELITTANGFAIDYCNLIEKKSISEETLELTKKFRDFKMAGTKGIEQCNIRSVILPLLADHVLREANHYIHLLKG